MVLVSQKLPEGGFVSCCVDEELDREVVCEVKNGVLYIGFKNKWAERKNARSETPATAWVRVDGLRSIEADGGCRITGDGNMVATGDLSVRLQGAAVVDSLTVSARSIHVDVRGVSLLRNFCFRSSEQLILNQYGTSKVDGTIEGGLVFLNLSEIGSLKLRGGAEQVVLNASGTSVADLSEYVVRTLTGKVTDLAKVKVHVKTDWAEQTK